MENIELSQQTSRKSYATTVQSDQVSFSNTADHLSARNVYKHDEDDMMTANHPPPRLSGESNSSIHMPPDPHGVEHKKTFSQRIKAKIPPLPLIRAIVKASFAVLIALIIAFVDTTRNAIGQGIILVPIGTILHFPIRPLGMCVFL